LSSGAGSAGSPARVFPKATSETATALIHSLFRLPPGDVLFGDFACALAEVGPSGPADGQIASHGRLYVTSSAVCFFADAGPSGSAAVRKVLPFKYVESLRPHRVAWVLPALAVTVEATGRRANYVLRGFFGSGRDEALSLCRLLVSKWRPGHEAAESPPPRPAPPGRSASVASLSPSLAGGSRARAGAAAGGGTDPVSRARSATDIGRDPAALAEAEAAFSRGKTLLSTEMACDVDGFWREFLADDAGFGALDAGRAAGYTALSVGAWEERAGTAGAAAPSHVGGSGGGGMAAPAGRPPRSGAPSAAARRGEARMWSLPRLTRAVRFLKRVVGVPFVSSTRVEQEHTLWRVADESDAASLVLDVVTRSLDVPYGDTFVIAETTLVQPAGPGRCRVRLSVQVRFESRGLLSGQIESSAVAGMQPDVDAWSQRAVTHLAAQVAAEAGGRGGGVAVMGDVFSDQQLEAATAAALEEAGRSPAAAAIAAAAPAWCRRALGASAPAGRGALPGPSELRKSTVAAALGAYGRLHAREAATRGALCVWRAAAACLVLALLLLLATGWWTDALARPLPPPPAPPPGPLPLPDVDGADPVSRALLAELRSLRLQRSAEGASWTAIAGAAAVLCAVAAAIPARPVIAWFGGKGRA